jgi:hypothetical protein
MLLAGGDTEGCVNVYRLRGREKEKDLDAHVKDSGDENVLPPNKENWAKEVAYYHGKFGQFHRFDSVMKVGALDNDPIVNNVTAICFNPDSTMAAR